MRIAVISDVHGNLPALQAALDAIVQDGCDAIYHTGDVIAIGPFPRECVDLLLERDVHCVLGNHDLYFVDGIPDPRPAYMGDGELIHQEWVRSQLSDAHKRAMSRWPMVLQESFAGVPVAFLHYGLAGNGRDFAPIIRNPTATNLTAIFTGIDARLIFYGHSHIISDVQGAARYVNPGSLGCRVTAVAHYALAEFEDNDYSLAFREVEYDDQPLQDAFEARQVPERANLYNYFFGGRFSVG